MTSREIGTYAFYCLTFSTFFVLIVLALKTKWYRTQTGRNLMALSASLTGVAITVVLQLLQWLEPEPAAWLRIVGFVSITLTLLWRGILVLYYNWHYWVWSKEDLDG